MVNVKAKRFYRKRPRRRGNKRVTTKKGVTKIVKRVLHSQIENKRAFNLANLEITGQMNAVNCFQVLPQMLYGSREEQRVGNVISPRSLRLGITMTMLAEPYALNGNDMGRSGVYFDLYIFKCIQKPSYDQPILGSDLDFFLQAGDAANRYEANPFNWHQTINKQRFICLHRSRRLMNSTSARLRDGVPTINEDTWGQNTNSSYSTTISLSKKLKTKLKYNDAGGNATNCGIYAVVVATRADNIQFSDITFPAGQVSFYSEMVYEDA